MEVIALSDWNLKSIPQISKALGTDIHTNNTSSRTINSSKRKEVVTTNSVYAGAQPVGATENPQRDDISREVCGDVSSISNLIAQQVIRQAPKRKKFETLHRENEALLTLHADVRYLTDL